MEAIARYVHVDTRALTIQPVEPNAMLADFNRRLGSLNA
jgi:hypothetical protein